MWYLPGSSIGITESIYSMVVVGAFYVYLVALTIIFLKIKRSNRKLIIKDLITSKAVIIVLNVSVCLLGIQLVYYQPYNTNLNVDDISSINISFESFSKSSFQIEDDVNRQKVLDMINSLDFKRTTGTESSFFLNDDAIFLYFSYHDQMDFHYMQLLIDTEHIALSDSYTHIISSLIGDDTQVASDFEDLLSELILDFYKQSTERE